MEEVQPWCEHLQKPWNVLWRGESRGERMVSSIQPLNDCCDAEQVRSEVLKHSLSPMRQMCRKGVCSAAGKAKWSCTVPKMFWELRIRYLKLNIWRRWKLGIHQCVFSPVKCCDRCQILQRCCKYQSIACKALRCMAILENSCGKIRKSVFTTEILNFWSCRAVLPQRLLTCGFGLSAVVFF